MLDESSTWYHLCCDDDFLAWSLLIPLSTHSNRQWLLEGVPLSCCDLQVFTADKYIFLWSGVLISHVLKRPQTCTISFLRLGVVLLEYSYKRTSIFSGLLGKSCWWMQLVMLANSTEPGLPIGWCPGSCCETSHHFFGISAGVLHSWRANSAWLIVEKCICLCVFYLWDVPHCSCKGKMCLQKKHTPQMWAKYMYILHAEKVHRIHK